jgi:hypothetical protein
MTLLSLAWVAHEFFSCAMRSRLTSARKPEQGDQAEGEHCPDDIAQLSVQEASTSAGNAAGGRQPKAG